MPIPTADLRDKETQTPNPRPTGSAGYASLDTLASTENNSSGRRIGTGSGSTVSAPKFSSSENRDLLQNAESERAVSKEEADRLYEERIQDEYAKREGGA